MPKENLALFSYYKSKDAKVMIYFGGKLVLTYSGNKGTNLLKKINSLSDEDQQLYLAKLTGNFKRGNEKVAKNKDK